MVTATDSFDARSTTVQIPVPKGTTGMERIILAAQGDLQRLLSLFFGKPIFIDCVYANTGPRLTPASPEHPITQTRQVLERCAGRIVCTATSHVTITSSLAETLFLDDKFPIGQMFRKMGRPPTFSLQNVETDIVDGKRELRRTYTLSTEGFFCEILEVFPDRDMFVQGEAWLREGAAVVEDEAAL